MDMNISAILLGISTQPGSDERNHSRKKHMDFRNFSLTTCKQQYNQKKRIIGS
jgi:hypothetical protein